MSFPVEYNVFGSSICPAPWTAEGHDTESQEPAMPKSTGRKKRSLLFDDDLPAASETTPQQPVAEPKHDAVHPSAEKSTGEEKHSVFDGDSPAQKEPSQEEIVVKARPTFLAGGSFLPDDDDDDDMDESALLIVDLPQSVEVPDEKDQIHPDVDSLNKVSTLVQQLDDERLDVTRTSWISKSGISLGAGSGFSGYSSVIGGLSSSRISSLQNRKKMSAADVKSRHGAAAKPKITIRTQGAQSQLFDSSFSQICSAERMPPTLPAPVVPTGFSQLPMKKPVVGTTADPISVKTEKKKEEKETLFEQEDDVSMSMFLNNLNEKAQKQAQKPSLFDSPAGETQTVILDQLQEKAKLRASAAGGPEPEKEKPSSFAVQAHPMQFGSSLFGSVQTEEGDGQDDFTLELNGASKQEPLGVSTVNRGDSVPDVNQGKAPFAYDPFAGGPSYVAESGVNFGQVEEFVVPFTATGKDIELLAESDCLYETTPIGGDAEYTLDLDELDDVEARYPWQNYKPEEMSKKDNRYDLMRCLEEMRSTLLNAYTNLKVLVKFYLCPLRATPGCLDETEIQQLFGGVVNMFIGMVTVINFLRRDKCNMEDIRDDNKFFSDFAGVISSNTQLMDGYIEFAKAYTLRLTICTNVLDDDDNYRYATARCIIFSSDLTCKLGFEYDGGEKCWEPRTEGNKAHWNCKTNLKTSFDHVYQDILRISELMKKIVSVSGKLKYTHMEDSFKKISQFFETLKERSSEELKLYADTQLVRAIEFCIVKTLDDKNKKKKSFFGLFRKKQSPESERARTLCRHIVVASKYGEVKTKEGVTGMFFILYKDLLILTSSVADVQEGLKEVVFEGKCEVNISHWFDFDKTEIRVVNKAQIILTDHNQTLTITGESFCSKVQETMEEFKRQQQQKEQQQ